MNVREVPSQDINKTLLYPWVDKTRKPYVADTVAYIPVKDGFPYTRTLPERRRTGRGYQKIGPVIAFHGIKPEQSDIDDVISSHNPQAVIWYRGHQGDMRIPDIVILWGEVHDVIHKESGVRYHINPARVMFSQGNREEKSRIKTQVRPGEQVCDMFAGIGYFTLPMAHAGAQVHAIELNPDAVYYLARNVHENNLEKFITITSGDCRDSLIGTYDRVHMGHYEAVRFLMPALNHVKAGTILHVHGIGDNTGLIQNILTESGMQATMNHRIIKKIGPGKVHTVCDLRIT